MPMYLRRSCSNLHILDIYTWMLTHQRQICTAVLLFNIWSKYDNFGYLMTYFGCVNKFAWHVYFIANLKYANKLLKHMSHGYIHTCLPWLDPLPTYLHSLAHWTLDLLIVLIMTDFVESKVGHMHIWFDHVPIAKYTFHQQQWWEECFANSVCGPLYIHPRHLPIFFLNDLFCKIESAIQFFLI